MRRYELMLLLRPDLDDERLQAAVERVTRAIVNAGGSLSKVSPWGKRRLAYEINHQREGYYVLVEATAEPEAMATLDRALHLADEVLRHKVVRIPDRVAGRASRSVPPPGEPEPPSSFAAPDAGNGLAAPEAASGTSTSANGA